MNEDISQYAPTRQTAIKTLYKTFEILQRNGGELSGREVMQQIERELTFSDYEKELYVKTGNVRWQSILHFYTIDASKAGYMYKKSGLWILTKEGEEAMKLGPIGLFESAQKAYKSWRNNNPKTENNKYNEDEFNDDSQLQRVTIEQLEEQAIQGLREFLQTKNPYEFQDIVAALLRAMGYYTPFVAPVGKDGGVDIIAYKDPLGVEIPKIKVQVKHYPDTPIAVGDIRSLVGIVNGSNETGIFVTSGSFSREAERFAREGNIHVELIDFTKLIDLWKMFYHKMSDEDKNKFPLQSIYFLGSNE